MSPRPAAPSSASISACVTTSPSECPARPRGEAISTPPRTSGTPPAKAWASTPIPTRRSGTVEGLRQLVQRADAQAAGFGADLEVRPRAAADLNGDEPGLARGHDVVVEAVADVGHFVRSGAALGDDAREEFRRGLLDTPARRRGDDVDRQLLAACPLLELRALVPGDAEEVAGAAQPLEARKRIGVEVLRGVDDLVARLAAEELEDAPVMLAARDRRAERGPHDVRGHTEPLGVLGPVARLVDERLADVEEHGLHSHDATSSRSDGSATFSRRGPPGTPFTRPPARSTSAAQSLASPPAATARRRTGATKACGVCTATRSSRGTVSTTASPRTRFTVSASGRPGTPPSQPSPSGSSTRPTTSSVTSGRAASCTSATAASSGTSASASRTDPARLGLPPRRSPRRSPRHLLGRDRRHRLRCRSQDVRAMPARPSETTGRLAGIVKIALRRSPGFGLRLLAVRGRADVGQYIVEPVPGLVLVHCLRVHELAGEDLLRLHEHLLLAGREALLVVAEREVADDLGQLEDVARLHLVAVV